MRAFYTPPKSKPFTAVAVAATLLSPLVVLVHHSVRLTHGEYPRNADAIAIPIFGYCVMVFPFGLLFLVQGLRRYMPNVSLLAWNSRRLGRSLGWTALTIVTVGWSAVGMVFEAIQGRLYWVAAFFFVDLFFVLVFRA